MYYYPDQQSLHSIGSKCTVDSSLHTVVLIYYGTLFPEVATKCPLLPTVLGPPHRSKESIPLVNFNFHLKSVQTRRPVTETRLTLTHQKRNSLPALQASCGLDLLTYLVLASTKLSSNKLRRSPVRQIPFVFGRDDAA